MNYGSEEIDVENLFQHACFLLDDNPLPCGKLFIFISASVYNRCLLNIYYVSGPLQRCWETEMEKPQALPSESPQISVIGSYYINIKSDGGGNI